MPKIRWKSIKNFPNYSVSTKGEIWSSKSNRKLSPYKSGQGYKAIVLCLNGKKYRRYIHRLIGEVFLNLKKNQEINHINGLKNDNRLENLEVCDKSHNMKHSYKLGLHIPYKRDGGQNPNAKISKFDVDDIRNLFKNGKTLKEVARRYNMSISGVHKIKNGITWSY